MKKGEWLCVVNGFSSKYIIRGRRPIYCYRHCHDHSRYLYSEEEVKRHLNFFGPKKIIKMRGEKNMQAGRRTDPERTVRFMNEILDKYNLTIPQIAEWLGISTNQVYNWRSGKIGFKKVHLLALTACIEMVLNKDKNEKDPYAWFCDVPKKFEELCKPYVKETAA